MSLSWETTFESLSSLGSKSEKQEAKAGGKVILCGMSIQRPKKRELYRKREKAESSIPRFREGGESD